jgi:hypothetical protein
MLFNRRQMLAVGAGALGSLAMRQALADPRLPVFGGWVDMEGAKDQFLRNTDRPYLRDHNPNIKGDGRNKQISLIKPYERVTGHKFVPNFQEIGDCCGEAGTMGAQVLSAVQIDVKKKNEEWKGPFSVEFTYGSSRVEIGGSRIRRGEGSTGVWTAESMRRMGLLRRAKYGKYDLTKYRPDLGSTWGRPGVGVPSELETIAKDHPVKTVALVKSWAEACDCIANGFPVLICSSIGYNTQTDKEGFLYHGRIIWYHAMLLVGIDTVSRRQGGLVANSWGPDWLAGPQHALGTPAGCFWADARNIDLAVSQGDSFALSNFVGFPRQKLDYLLY